MPECRTSIIWFQLTYTKSTNLLAGFLARRSLGTRRRRGLPVGPSVFKAGLTEFSMSINKLHGDRGERAVIEFVLCPNCGKKLMGLPPNYPLYDVQCTGCSFRAQVKTSHSKPRGVIFGAGWDIMEKVLKSGFMTPPIFVNFTWQEAGVARREIRFYPFVPKDNLRKYRLSPTARRANYKMFNYIGLDTLPHFVVFQK